MKFNSLLSNGFKTLMRTKNMYSLVHSCSYNMQWTYPPLNTMRVNETKANKSSRKKKLSFVHHLLGVLRVCVQWQRVRELVKNVSVLNSIKCVWIAKNAVLTNDERWKLSRVKTLINSGSFSFSFLFFGSDFLLGILGWRSCARNNIIKCCRRHNYTGISA